MTARGDRESVAIITILLRPPNACGQEVPDGQNEIVIEQPSEISEETTTNGNCTIKNATLTVSAPFHVSNVLAVKSQGRLSLVQNGTANCTFFDVEVGAEVRVYIHRTPRERTVINVATYASTTFAQDRNTLEVVTQFPEDCVQTQSEVQQGQGSLSVIVQPMNSCPEQYAGESVLTTEAIIGIAVGGAVAAVLVVLIMALIVRSRRRKDTQAINDGLKNEEINNLQASSSNLKAMGTLESPRL